jgi:membrane-associated protein
VFDVDTIVQTGGLLAICLIIFAESGILLGFFLPGDSLLFAAGLFAAKGHLPLEWLLVLVVLSAIIGYEVGYILGRRAGPKLFNRNNGFLFRQEYIGRSERFFEKYGGITVVAARFVAHVRTFVSVIAGASRMDRRKYFAYNVIGAVLWGGGLILIGYWLGVNVPDVDRYIIPVVLIGLAIFYTVGLWHLLKTPERRHKLKKASKKIGITSLNPTAKRKYVTA